VGEPVGDFEGELANLGHEKADDMTHGLYRGGANLETKREAVEKLSYPG